MKEKAHIFFALLNESYKQDAGEKLHQINIATVPHLKKGDATKVINSYKAAASDIMDLTESNDDFSALNTLKNELGK